MRVWSNLDHDDRCQHFFTSIQDKIIRTIFLSGAVCCQRIIFRIHAFQSDGCMDL